MRTGCAGGTNSSAGRLTRSRSSAVTTRPFRVRSAASASRAGAAARPLSSRRGLRAADRDRRAGRARPRRSGLPVPLRLRQHARGAGRRAACGKTRSCGCLRRDRSGWRPVPPPAVHPGERYGRLVVLREAERPASGGARAYVCVCVCGQQTTVRGSNLKRGHTRSCGCLLQDYRRRGGRRSTDPAAARDSLRSGRAEPIVSPGRCATA